MARNIEIKARVRDLTELRTRIAAVAPAGPTLLIQRDTFYEVPKGRLKLREMQHGATELIFYERANETGPKKSSYTISPVHAASMHELLVRFLRVRGVVSKRRELFTVGQTRIHLDDVENLGWFLELEIVLQAEQLESDGTEIALQLMKRLGIREDDLVEQAYVDLLESFCFPSGRAG